MGVYHFAATPPGLNNFANKFIGDFAKCFNLTVTNRVRATDLTNPDIPEVTEINDVCKPLAGSPTTSYLHNGYNAGQQWYWLLSDGAMTKTARITEMEKRGMNGFMHHQLPEAIITLKQGAGRLIRDETDRGVLMICDPRLISKPYGKRIWQSLPPFARSRELGSVISFLQRDLGSQNPPSDE
jgi:hypothetical protein